MNSSTAQRFFHAACAALVLLAPAILRAQSGTLDKIHRRDRLIVGSDMVFPIFNFKNPDTGRAEGFLADLARALAKQLLGDENKVEFRRTEEKTRLEAVARGEIDVLIDTIPASEEKLKVVDFSDETFRSGSALLVKASSPIKTIDDITKNTRVIYSKANPDIKFIRAKAPEATYLEFENSTDAVAALKAGRGDVFTQVVTHLYRAASQNPGYQLTGRFTTKSYGIVLPKGDPALRGYLNDFLRSLRASGEYDRLFKKWFGPYGGEAVR